MVSGTAATRRHTVEKTHLACTFGQTVQNSAIPAAFNRLPCPKPRANKKAVHGATVEGINALILRYYFTACINHRFPQMIAALFGGVIRGLGGVWRGFDGADRPYRSVVAGKRRWHRQNNVHAGDPGCTHRRRLTGTQHRRQCDVRQVSAVVQSSEGRLSMARACAR